MATTVTKAKLGVEDLWTDAATHATVTSTGGNLNRTGLASLFATLAGSTFTDTVTIDNAGGVGLHVDAGTVAIDETLTVTGACTVGGTLIGTVISASSTLSALASFVVVGTSTLGGAATFTATMAKSGVAGAQSLRTDTLLTSGLATFHSISQTANTAALNAVTITNGLTAGGGATVTGGLTVSGSSLTLTSASLVASASTAQFGTVKIDSAASGAALSTTTLYASGAVTFASTLAVTGALTVDGTTTLNGELTIEDTFTANGQFCVHVLNAISGSTGSITLDAATQTVFRYAPATTLTITGISNAADGQMIVIVNDGGAASVIIQDALIANESADVNLANGERAIFFYINSSSHLLLVAETA